AHFTRHQHSHATSCRHFNLGAPQAPISAEFPVGHASQPPQTGLAPHHPPPLTALPAPPQFQDIPGPPFLPQALHQQYLIQQQLLEAQHRRILPHSRRTPERVPLNPHRLRSGYDYSPPLHVPQPISQQPRYLAEGTDWDLSVDAGLSHHQYQLQQLPQHYQHYLASSPRMHHFPRNTTSAQVVVHEIRNYPYPQLHLLALQGLNPSRHASAVRESYEELLQLEDRLGSVSRGAVQTTIERFTFPHKYKKRKPLEMKVGEKEEETDVDEKCTICLSMLEDAEDAVTLHAPLPPGLCGPVAGDQQEVSNLPRGHRDAAPSRQLIGPGVKPDGLAAVNHPGVFPAPLHPGPGPSPHGCFAKCLQTSCDIITLSDSRFTEPTQDYLLHERMESLSLSLSIKAHPRQKDKQTHSHIHTLYTRTGFTSCLLEVGCCCCRVVVGRGGRCLSCFLCLCSMFLKP
ncbi:unnamed protein product, partial [Coregonus sp. 'balchen']